ncbi:homeodomain-only protein [Engraulis encrasicolus]|uniref:homeodomain-only protein n=1 Tax=Engraulis encrasicolus TaxID=184585 RepID=UPI002FD49B92
MAAEVSMGLGVAAMQLAEDQIKVLEENFTKVTKHPDETTLMLIAAECGLSEEDTAKWFRLRNALWRQAEGLPAELGSVKD